MFIEFFGIGDSEKILIEKMFGGKLRIYICCLNCGSILYKVEVFIDFSLVFCFSFFVEDLFF